MRIFLCWFLMLLGASLAKTYSWESGTDSPVFIVMCFLGLVLAVVQDVMEIMR